MYVYIYIYICIYIYIYIYICMPHSPRQPLLRDVELLSAAKKC